MTDSVEFFEECQGILDEIESRIAEAEVADSVDSDMRDAIAESALRPLMSALRNLRRMREILRSVDPDEDPEGEVLPAVSQRIEQLYTRARKLVEDDLED